MIDWLLVIPVPGLTEATAGVVSQVLALLRPERALGVSIVDTKGDPHLRRQCADAGASYLQCSTVPFVWGYAANLGAFSNKSSKLCFLHSDISVPAGMLWLDALAYTLDTTHGLVAPMIEGSSPNPLQHYRGPADVPYYHTTSYISNACYAIEYQKFAEIGGFAPVFCGTDWWANYLQEKMTQRGLPTVIVPSSTISHTGSKTAICDDRRRQNMLSFCDITGICSEYGARPSVVRSRIQCERSQAIIVDGFHLTSQPVDIYDYQEIVIIDSKPSRESFQKCRDTFNQWSYSPVLDDYPERLAVDLCGGKTVTVLDRRVSPLVHGATGKPWRYGHGYALPQHMTEVHITNMMASAVGDTLMATPALTALKRTYPWLKIHVYSSGYSAPLLQNNPSIDELHSLDKCVVINNENFSELHPEAVAIGAGVGREGTVQYYYHELGLTYPDRPDPLVLMLTEDENQEALEWLTGIDIDMSKPIIGLVLHGGWKSKYWARSAAACKILTRMGYQVLTFGIDDERAKRIDHPGVYHLHGLQIRTVAAVINQIDGMIGYDSGLSFVSSAVGTPIVCMYGPHDPAGLICQAGGGKLIAMRKRAPSMCEDEFGKSCRTHGEHGTHCVLREGPGGKCIDEISVHEVIAELEKIVKRKSVAPYTIASAG